MRSGKVAVAVSLLGLAAGSGLAGAAAGSGPVDEAIGLYRAARYAEALEVLDEVEAAPDRGALERMDHDAADLYRALCLFALERDADARAALRHLVERRPDYAFDEGELPPRVLAAVRDTQGEVIPAAARSEYTAGKESYDRGLYGEAGRRLRTVVRLARSGSLEPAVRESLQDLGVVAAGFLDLIESLRVGEVPPLPPAAASSAPGAVVTPPVVIRQDLPHWESPGGRAAQAAQAARGTLEIVIGPTGRVEAARLLEPVEPRYDARLLAATRKWRYRPATRAGEPVSFRKTLDIQVVAGGPTPR